MKKDMPLEGLRWSRDSGSALYDTPQTAVLGRAGGSCGKRIVLPWFSQYFCSVEETRQRQNGLVILKPLLHYIICMLRF